MAYEQTAVTTTLLTGSTGIAYARFVAGTAGRASWPTAGGVDAIGVTVSTASSGTTEDLRACTVALPGSIVRVASTASTLAAGDLISCTSRGRIKVLASGNNNLGVIIAGSSGAARFVTVLLTMMGTT